MGNCKDIKRILFILKKRGGGGYVNSVGLINSAKLTSRVLNSISGIVSKVVAVEDNNKIHKEVVDFKPDFVIIEALWVVNS